MSILGNLLNGVFGNDDKEEASEPKPCSNCLSTCAFHPDACGECAPCKEKLIDLLYEVEHLEEYYDRYEVVSAAVAEGTVNCPACGAPNPASAVACEFCGTQLREGSAKIQVASASDIPDPIQLAQDVIFERQQIVQKYEREKSGFLENLTELLSGDEAAALTGRMSTDEVKAVAAEYGVSVGTYLQGLDNGIYLTAAAKKKKDAAAAAQAAAAAATASAAAAYRPPVQQNYRPVQQQNYRPRQERPVPPPPPPRPRREQSAASPAQYGHFGPRQDDPGRDGRSGSGRNARPAGKPGAPQNNRFGPADRPGMARNDHLKPGPGSMDSRNDRPGPAGMGGPAGKAAPGGRSPAKPAPGGRNGGRAGGRPGKNGK